MDVVRTGLPRTGGHLFVLHSVSSDARTTDLRWGSPVDDCSGAGDTDYCWYTRSSWSLGCHSGLGVDVAPRAPSSDVDRTNLEAVLGAFTQAGDRVLPRRCRHIEHYCSVCQGHHQIVSHRAAGRTFSGCIDRAQPVGKELIELDIAGCGHCRDTGDVGQGTNGTADELRAPLRLWTGLVVGKVLCLASRSVGCVLGKASHGHRHRRAVAQCRTRHGCITDAALEVSDGSSSGVCSQCGPESNASLRWDAGNGTQGR